MCIFTRENWKCAFKQNHDGKCQKDTLFMKDKMGNVLFTKDVFQNELLNKDMLENDVFTIGMLVN